MVWREKAGLCFGPVWLEVPPGLPWGRVELAVGSRSLVQGRGLGWRPLGV